MREFSEEVERRSEGKMGQNGAAVTSANVKSHNSLFLSCTNSSVVSNPVTPPCPALISVFLPFLITWPPLLTYTSPVVRKCLYRPTSIYTSPDRLLCLTLTCFWPRVNLIFLHFTDLVFELCFWVQTCFYWAFAGLETQQHVLWMFPRAKHTHFAENNISESASEKAYKTQWIASYEEFKDYFSQFSNGGQTKKQMKKIWP